MLNKRMEEALLKGDCIDVRTIGTRMADGSFLLERFVDGKDYADAETERWIFSIGRSEADGKIYAAFDFRFYECPGWECLFLR